MIEIRQQIKTLIDKAFATVKSADEREKMTNDLVNAIPCEGSTSVYCKYVGNKISKVGIMTRYSDSSIAKRYYVVSNVDESLDW